MSQIKPLTVSVFEKYLRESCFDLPIIDLSRAEYDEWRVGKWLYKGMRNRLTKAPHGLILKLEQTKNAEITF